MTGRFIYKCRRCHQNTERLTPEIESRNELLLLLGEISDDYERRENRTIHHCFKNNVSLADLIGIEIPEHDA